MGDWPEHLPAPRELLRRILGSRLLDRAAGEPPRPRWGIVRNLAGLGSTYSADLCLALELDPDAKVGQTSWEALESVLGEGLELTEEIYEAALDCESPPVEERYRRPGS